MLQPFSANVQIPCWNQNIAPVGWNVTRAYISSGSWQHAGDFNRRNDLLNTKWLLPSADNKKKNGGFSDGMVFPESDVAVYTSL